MRLVRHRLSAVSSRRFDSEVCTLCRGFSSSTSSAERAESASSLLCNDLSAEILGQMIGVDVFEKFVEVSGEDDLASDLFRKERLDEVIEGFKVEGIPVYDDYWKGQRRRRRSKNEPNMTSTTSED